ncbi:MAG: alpha/beta hydrolase, partial [Steroidobacteraceae bacterium]|nr:alpha/beta hydrolase [Steroidobacteraceae bacterium]
GFAALAPDLPGYGQSDPNPEPNSLDRYAAILPAALRSRGWDSAHLVGHHTGAVVAACFARAAPAAVRRLVLNGFPLLSAEEREHFLSFYFGPPQPRADGSHLLDAWHNRLRSTPGWRDLDLMHRYTVIGLASGAHNWKAFPLIIAADLAQLLRDLAVPTLLLTNTGEDLYAATQRCRALRPDFAYAELQGGTHDIIDEQPQEWLRAVVTFLQGAHGG